MPTDSVSDGKRVPSSAATQAIEWATWTGVLGDEVSGMWPKYSQVNDINATHASYRHGTIVTGDDFGLVKLFRFPCTTKGKFLGWLPLLLICFKPYHDLLCRLIPLLVSQVPSFASMLAMQLM